jgi:hypothetical protein
MGGLKCNFGQKYVLDKFACGSDFWLQPEFIKMGGLSNQRLGLSKTILENH